MEENRAKDILDALDTLESHIRRTIVHKDGTCTMELDFPNYEEAKQAAEFSRTLVRLHK